MKISGQLHAPAAVTADKTPMLVKQEVCGGGHNRRGHFVDRKSLAPTATQTPDRPSRDLATTPTALSS